MTADPGIRPISAAQRTRQEITLMGRTSPGLLFVLPALIVLAMLIAYPLAYTGVLSVTDNDGAFVGVKNFNAVLGARATPQAFWNTIWYVGGSIVFQVLFGTMAAILLNQTFFGRGAIRAITLIPWVVPGIVAATTWAWMFHTEFGIINYMLTGPGIIAEPVGWLTNRDTVLPVLIAINIWKLFPFVAIMVLAALQTIPEELYESARMDGASFWHEIRHIMLPQVRPVLTAVTLLLVIWGLNAITIIYAITRGGPANRSLITPIQIFRLAFESTQFNQSAALSIMFFGVAIIIVFIYIKVLASNPADAK
jgi:multiple sugar transport system permease protein